ncbi:MAG: class I SAM-dependent methyltransferase [Pirellulales bacterium]|nr:class I SAM-dependent methyltransferase [Pirellulales bacterium]
MNHAKINPFDETAAQWDAEPRRVDLARAVGQAILRHARPTPDMNVLDYGCGTGLLGRFLLPHVQNVTGADSSPGMLQVLEDKIRSDNLRHMRATRLDLEHDPVPETRYHLIVANMVLHHVRRIDVLLAAFHRMTLPGGMVALADLDAEPGTFHRPDTKENVFHHGFDRREFMDCLRQVGFVEVSDATAHVIRKPIATGEVREFPVFLIVGRCAGDERPPRPGHDQR